MLYNFYRHEYSKKGVFRKQIFVEMFKIISKKAKINPLNAFFVN